MSDDLRDKKIFAELRAQLDHDIEARKSKDWINNADPLSLEHGDYLETKLWKKLKKRVLERDNQLCRRCGGKADLVHHISYERDVMLGNNDAELVSLCSGCHVLIHFQSNGNKRSPEQQHQVLSDPSFNEDPPKIDLRYTNRRPPGWKRLTAIQKKHWVAEFSKRKHERSVKTANRKSDSQ